VRFLTDRFDFDKDRIFALADDFQNVAADVVVQYDFCLHVRMCFHKGFRSFAAFFFVGGKDNAELEFQVVLQNMKH